MNIDSPDKARAHLEKAMAVRDQIMRAVGVPTPLNGVMYTAFAMIALEYGRAGPNGVEAELQGMLDEAQRLFATYSATMAPLGDAAPTVPRPA